MKKAILAAALCLVLVLLSGCSLWVSMLLPEDSDFEDTSEPISTPSFSSPSPSAESSCPVIPAPEPTMTPEELLNTLRFHLELINQCYAETCGAKLGNTEYCLVYRNQEAAMEGDAPIAVVEKSAMDSGNSTDPTDSVLYEILNFRTNAEALDYLEQYMAPDIAKRLFHEFLEMDGKLYMVYGGRGYGATQLDLDTASITVSDNTCTVTLDFCLFEEKVNTCTVFFEKQEGNWIVTAIEGDRV